MKTLQVLLRDTLVGVLSQDDSGRLFFQYDNTYLQSDNVRAISLSMPLSDTAYEDRIARPFFNSLLPDEQQRQLVASRLGVSANSPFSLLREIGAECAGALAVVSPDYGEIDDENPALLTDDDLCRLLQRQSNVLNPIGVEIRLSLAGAQQKIALIYQDEEFYKPTLNTPSTHILKPESTAFPNMVQNEFFCMKLAQHVGIETADVDMFELSCSDTPLPILRIKRFDRANGDRIHQEDFCQALSIPPENKYANEGGVRHAQSIALINKCDFPALDKMRYLRLLIFNYLIGNNDAHGKNFSLYHTYTGMQMTPAYDLLSTQAMGGGLSEKMAMPIAKKYNPTDVYARHWETFATECGYKPKSVINQIIKWSHLLQTKAPELAKNLYGNDVPDMVNTVIDVINQNAQMTLDRLEK